MGCIWGEPSDIAGTYGKTAPPTVAEPFFAHFYRLPSLKEAHSVPSHLVGAQSQQPTLMESREQQF